MASYSSAVNLQLPETPRLAARGNEAVYAEFMVVYNAIRNLVQGMENGDVGTVNWGSIGGSISDQTDLVAVLNALVPEAPEDGTIYGRQNAAWVPVPGGGGGSGGILPMVTGEIVDDQPVFVYNPDGSLVWNPIL